MAIFSFLFFVFTTLATTGCASSHKTSVSEPGSDPLVLASADGSTVKLDELWHDRKATVLVFWSGGCPLRTSLSRPSRRVVRAISHRQSLPKIGLNPIVFTLHKMQDMMTFVPVDDATLVFDPEMPSMGHGSSGSVNPTATSLGRYEGQLSFSMAGTWDTTVTVSQAGVTLGTPMFTTTF